MAASARPSGRASRMAEWSRISPRRSRSLQGGSSCGTGRPSAEIDVALVDYTGALASGRLMRGDNPVLMTFELVLEVE